MLKKEIMDTLKQTTLVLSFLLLIPIVFWVNNMILQDNPPFSFYLTSGVMLGITLLAFSLAYTMFSSKRDEFKNLLSTASSKWELLAVKTLPRLTVVWILMLAFLIIGAMPPEQIAGSAFMRILGIRLGEFLVIFSVPLLIMLSGFFLGMADKKSPLLIGCFLLAMTYPLLTGPKILINVFDKVFIPLRITAIATLDVATIITVLLPSALVVCVLIPFYKSWNASSEKIKKERMLKRMAGPVGLIILLSAYALVS
ncbi:MAG: hypothetical protein KAR40_08420 [Candidatus Sabulitectum sp.]|nr:hypothetical protein [Candidatus Sabulitectum sp.]